jgi:hypothetical protein
MRIIEPRVVSVGVGKCLLHHLDIAQQASYSVKELLKHLKSSADLKRIQVDRLIAKQYEEQKAEKEMQLKLSSIEVQGHFEAATVISLLYRKYKAVKTIRALEALRVVEEAKKAVRARAVQCTKIQKLFRQYSTQIWFRKRGVIFDYSVIDEDDPRYTQSRRKKMTHDTAGVRAGWEVQQRRVLERLRAIHLMRDRHVEVTQMLGVNIRHWEGVAASIRPRQGVLNEVASRCKRDHQEGSKVGKPLGKVERRAYEVRLEVMLEPVFHIKERVENLEGLYWWCLHLLRAAYRRRAALNLRYTDSMTRLEWGSVEAALVSRMQWQMAQRVERFSGRAESVLMVDWLVRHVGYCEDILVCLDSQQETIIQVLST